MILGTLSDYLYENCISKKDACILFGRSRQTLERWNDNPPEWVIRIIKMVGQHKVLPEIWDGWYFSGEYLHCPDRNKYHHDDVKMLWLTLQRIRSYEDPMMIESLKRKLQRKIDLLNSEVKLTIVVGDGLTKEIKINPTAFMIEKDALDVLVS